MRGKKVGQVVLVTLRLKQLIEHLETYYVSKKIPTATGKMLYEKTLV